MLFLVIFMMPLATSKKSIKIIKENFKKIYMKVNQSMRFVK